MKRIPDLVSPQTKSSAERYIFGLLEHVDLGDDAVAFHSINLSHHEYKVAGEIDFVILTPEALLILEVKGGGVGCNGGQWYYIDRNGSTARSSEGPFKQAASAMWSLRERLADDIDPSEFLSGYAVVIPDNRFDVASVEWDPDIVIDGPQLTGGAEGLERALRRVIKYWQAKISKTAVTRRATLGRIAERLRPSFEKIPSIAYRADAIEQRMESLTRDQYRLLDAARDNPRILCRGGAGTGKTFLLAELARRQRAAGKSVLVTCASETLAAYIRARLPADVCVCPFDQLSAGPDRVHDVLLVDEGQDILSFDNLQILDDQVTGGLEHGTWRIFLDDNMQASIYGVLEQDALDYLVSFGMTLRLVDNCRNTKEIADNTKLATGGDIGHPVVGSGPPVSYRYSPSQSFAVQELAAVLDELSEDGVPPGQITILSTVDFPNSIASLCSSEFRIVSLSSALAADFPPTNTTFATFDLFKGLENQFVILVDIERAPSSSREISALYVGMTRARVSLTVLLAETAREGLQEIMNRNLPGLLAEQGLRS